MARINTGILTNTAPLTTEQIKALEQRAIEENNVFVYLDETSKICFTGSINPELVKDLAWHNVHTLAVTGETLTKTTYNKQSQKTFSIAEILQKQSYDEPWILISAQSNFTLANGDVVVLSDGLIFNTKEN